MEEKINEKNQNGDLEEIKSREPKIYNPEFIPFYPAIKKKYNLTTTETLIYGFIRFYISNSPGKKFYFSNKQLREILGLKTETGVSLAINSLIKKCPEIKAEYKVKANGGKIRFLVWLNSDFNSSYSRTLTPVKVNNNKINNNKTNNIFLSKDKNGDKSPGKKKDKRKKYGNEKVNSILTAFKKHRGFNPTDRQPRQQAWDIYQRFNTFLKKTPNLKKYFTDDFGWWLEKYFQFLKRRDYWDKIENLDAVRRKLTIFFAMAERKIKIQQRLEEIDTTIHSTMDSSMDSSIYSRHKTENINNKTENIKNKIKKINNKTIIKERELALKRLEEMKKNLSHKLNLK